ncbi:MAG: biotin--[acetyl-CoA-carboxylase] ligase [Lachnospiraceae bacterium]|nr:biotin--[acetyl-CoA-carboxylase] ligase [Lachnospiraceae bacterium]
MRTIDKVLQLLENNKEEFVSGQEMAKTHGISRNAIWKAIRELRNKGYIIDAVSNRGYRLSKNTDIVSSAGIFSHLDPGTAERCAGIEVHDSVDSTSDLAKELAIKGAGHGMTVISAKQTLGRGRRDHKFFSPEGGLYMSIVLKPEEIRFKDPDELTGFIGRSVIEAISDLTGQKPEIRGVNDLYIKDKKICGILIESGSEFDTGHLQWIVAGIGINFDSDISLFPDDIKKRSASLYKPGRAGITKNLLAAKIIENILRQDKALKEK